MKFSAWYSILVGILMIGQWGFFLGTGQVPELQTEPIRIAFHLAAELITAIMLVFGGYLLLKKTSLSKQLALVAAGMLLYTTIVSPGYFAQLGEWPIVIMFVLLICSNLYNIFVDEKDLTFKD
ncbi:MAG TPA: hypothetical protein VK856_01110 [Anaerolineaceae bacterium]|nr:hypothetical protein [Anaerolineaceae bacterium]